MYDAIVVGRGPAGLQAAIYIARAGLSVLVIGENDSALLKAAHVDNYFGFENTISGRELLEQGERQAKRFGAKILTAHVLNISYADNGFDVKTNAETYNAKTILIATGKPLPPAIIPGVKKFEGKGVSYCTTCDGFFFRGKMVGILGSKDYAISEAEEMEKFTQNITIYTNGKELEAEKNKYRVVTKKIKALQGENVLEKVVFDDDSEEEVQGLFIALDRPAGAEFARKLGIEIENDRIITDEDFQTNIPGIFAAGDCVSDFKQISVAVGQAALAARAMIKHAKNS
ncbi:MAG: NAD(P)/FAD-dependent oxidoreductase [Clostridiaceae bacterium]|nr:NAD(P)/FAD-dependent oxidoreductase [Clostridiaceae bacterium]